MPRWIARGKNWLEDETHTKRTRVLGKVRRSPERNLTRRELYLWGKVIFLKGLLPQVGRTVQHLLEDLVRRHKERPSERGREA